MKIYFIRHGETQYNKDGIFLGYTDMPLDDEGVRQAENAIDNIPEGITLIYSSNLLRCKQTTEIINEKLKVPVIYDVRLRERRFGLLEGTFVRDIDKGLSFAEADEFFVSKGAESFIDLKSRVVACVEDIKKSHPDDLILVVTSGGVIRSMYKAIKDEIYGTIPNLSIHEFEV